MSWESALVITSSLILRKNKDLQVNLSVEGSFEHALPLKPKGVK
jgi:hypothetical protein